MSDAADNKSSMGSVTSIPCTAVVSLLGMGIGSDTRTPVTVVVGPEVDEDEVVRDCKAFVIFCRPMRKDHGRDFVLA